jgi:NAD-specific glutamate dehydrogenase
MNHITNVHPDIVREAILSVASHPAKRRNLELIHEVCNEREKAGNKDFSLKAVGEAVEARGGIKVKALWNSQSSDYRKLIDAWQAYAGGPKLRELSKANPLDILTKNIADPATRIVVEKLISERNALRAEVNILKSQITLVIDRRPQRVESASAETADGSMTLEITKGPKLNVLEREAVEHAISLEFWRGEGWQEEKNGRVVKDLGEGRTRTIFKPGFVSAIRKILDIKQ